MNSQGIRFLRHTAGLLAILACAEVSAAASQAGHLVTFTSGSRLAVESFRMEGGMIQLRLEGGGEIGCSPESIAGIAPLPVAPGGGELSVLPPASAPVMAPLAAPSARVLATIDDDHVSPLNPEPGVKALIRKLARPMDLDAALVEAVVRTESGYNPYAVSRRGAMGLMQLMPGTARRFGVENAFDPADNLEGGMRYLKELLDRYGELRLALAAYNAGEEAVDRYGGVPPYPETRGYVGKILGLLAP